MGSTSSMYEGNKCILHFDWKFPQETSCKTSSYIRSRIYSIYNSEITDNSTRTSVHRIGVHPFSNVALATGCCIHRRRSNEEGWGGQDMQHSWGKKNMYTILDEKLKGKRPLRWLMTKSTDLKCEDMNCIELATDKAQGWGYVISMKNAEAL